MNHKHPIIRKISKLISFGVLLSCYGVSSQAQMPTQAQIDQFKSLPDAQKRQMAEAAGVDLNSILGNQEAAQPVLTDDPVQPTNNERPEKLADETSNENKKDDDERKIGTKRKALPMFGLDLFQNTSALRPTSDIPVPADYVMGPGDTLIIQLYGKENASYSLTINREGQIQFPQIGPVNLAGLTFNKAKEVIDDIVNKQMIGIKSSITMGRLRTIRVFVLGEVKRPGSFVVGSLSTLTNALFESGGITEVGNMRNIQLKRQGKVVTSFDTYDLLLKGDTSSDRRLLPGDVIFVPPIRKLASVGGEVIRPATYQLQYEKTVSELIQLAGGLKNSAFLPVSYLVRLDERGEKTLINLDLKSPSGMSANILNGDHLTIPSNLDFLNNQILLQGHVKRGGPRAWKPNQHFTDLIGSPLELLPNPDINIGLIERASPFTRQTEIVLFSPKNAWQSPASQANPIIQPYDVIHVFNFDDDRAEYLTPLVQVLKSQSNIEEREKSVSVNGSVRFPGVYPMAANMSSSELIELAGGLTESAMGSQGEITRYTLNESRQRVVSHQQVNLLEEEVELVPGDTLQVKQIPLWKEKESIEVTGEVVFPGSYSILPGETLADVLNRAGGLTQHAYALGAVFSREELRNLEQQRLDELKGNIQSELASSSLADDEKEIGAEEAEALIENIDTIKPLGRMVINLPQILSDPLSYDIPLEDGDTLHIPRFKPSVTVVGEVQYPTSHIFDDALDSMEYIERSGGLKKNADKKRIYIVKANGSVLQPERSAWFRADADTISPGDTIVVPFETDRLDKLTIWSKATQIIYQAALGAAALKAL